MLNTLPTVCQNFQGLKNLSLFVFSYDEINSLLLAIKFFTHSKEFGGHYIDIISSFFI